MKKIADRIEIETLLGGIFGAIAIIAIIVEMALAGFDATAIAGGLKDIAGIRFAQLQPLAILAEIYLCF